MHRNIVIIEVRARQGSLKFETLQYEEKLEGLVSLERGELNRSNNASRNWSCGLVQDLPEGAGAGAESLVLLSKSNAQTISLSSANIRLSVLLGLASASACSDGDLGLNSEAVQRVPFLPTAWWPTDAYKKIERSSVHM
ncbi:hypothetical protein Tco_0051806 [Tanacetum coccineum]